MSKEPKLASTSTFSFVPNANYKVTKLIYALPADNNSSVVFNTPDAKYGTKFDDLTDADVELLSQAGINASQKSSFGAELIEDGSSIRVSLANLHGTEIDASDIPDLVPVISAIAATADGTTKIYNATRIRLKESDRIKSTVEMINSLGGDAHETEDGIIINGRKSLSGGTVESFNDHRIVMAAAVASQKCENRVIINNAQAVNKSYPEFFKDFNSLGGDANVM